MSAAISPDVLELLEHPGEAAWDALHAGRCARDGAERSGPDADAGRLCARAMLVRGAAWALYALELHDAAATGLEWREDRANNWTAWRGAERVGMIYLEGYDWHWVCYTVPPDVEPVHGACGTLEEARAEVAREHKARSD